MLRLIAYDITHPRRLARVADVCLGFGVRVQKSVFECWLEDGVFRELMLRLQVEIDPTSDQILAYTLDAKAARERESLGQAMPSEPVAAFYVGPEEPRRRGQRPAPQASSSPRTARAES